MADKRVWTDEWKSSLSLLAKFKVYVTNDFESKVILVCEKGQRTFESLENNSISVSSKFFQESSPCNFKSKTNPSECFPRIN